MTVRKSLRFAASLFVVVAAHGSAGLALAQDAGPDSEPARVVRVTIEGDAFFDHQTLRLQLRTAANRRFLGIPGLTWWLWVYQLGDSGSLGGRFSRALMRSGEAPSRIDANLLDADVERLRLFYLQEGFRQATVETIVRDVGSNEVEVVFVIDPGPATYIRHVRYTGLEGVARDTRVRLARRSILQKKNLDPDSLRFVAVDERYSEPRLVIERRRIVEFLRNAGYADINRDSIRAIIFPQPADSFDVTIRIAPGDRYRFGDVSVLVRGPDERAISRTDTIGLGQGQMVVSYVGEPRLKTRLLRRSIQFRPGEWYEETAISSTRRRLEATGVFSLTSISGVRAGQSPDSVSLREHDIEVRTRRRHRVRFQTFLSQRGSVQGGASGIIGFGAATTYRNSNMFGSGETLTLRTSGSIALSSDTDFLSSAQAEFSATVTYPYLIPPFGRLERRFDFYDVRSRISTSLLTARREELGLAIRVRGNARLQLELQHERTITSYIDAFEISVSSPDILDQGFIDRVLGAVADNPVQRAQVLEDYTQPQINTALRYTLRAADVNPLLRSSGHSYETSFEIGGTVPRLLDRYVFSPDSLEGKIPGFAFLPSGGSNDSLLYRPYVRMTADLRRYRPLGRRTIAATRLFVGLAHPTKPSISDVVPFDRRFFSGGAFSVRGWGFGELGPGGVNLARDDSSGASGTSTNVLGGDIKLEGSFELRQTVLSDVLKADWILAGFADAGNVWFGPERLGLQLDSPDDADGKFRFSSFAGEVAIGSGLGVRLAWEYLIVRLDLAFRVRDPVRTELGLFPDGLRDPQLHFGIGHVF